MYKMNHSTIILSSVAILFGVIGLPLFFFGCVTYIPNACLSYTEIDGKVNNYFIKNITCRSGSTKFKNEYPCYDAFLELSYQRNSKNHSCNCLIYNREKNFDDLHQDLNNNFPIGYKSVFYLNKIDKKECYYDKNGIEILTYLGLLFCLFSFISTLIIIFTRCKITEKIKIHPYDQDDNLVLNPFNIQFIGPQNYTEFSQYDDEELKNPI